MQQTKRSPRAKTFTASKGFACEGGIHACAANVVPLRRHTAVKRCIPAAKARASSRFTFALGHR